MDVKGRIGEIINSIPLTKKTNKLYYR